MKSGVNTSFGWSRINKGTDIIAYYTKTLSSERCNHWKYSYVYIKYFKSLTQTFDLENYCPVSDKSLQTRTVIHLRHRSLEIEQGN